MREMKHSSTWSRKAWSMYRLAVLGTKSGDSRKRRKNSYTNYKMFTKRKHETSKCTKKIQTTAHLQTF